MNQIDKKIVCAYLYSITRYGYPPKASDTHMVYLLLKTTILSLKGGYGRPSRMCGLVVRHMEVEILF